MHAKFQVAAFQNKRDIRLHSLNFVWFFLLGYLPVHVTPFFIYGIIQFGPKAGLAPVKNNDEFYNLFCNFGLKSNVSSTRIR